MFVFRHLNNYHINLSSWGIESVAFCVEEWPIPEGRIIYSIFSCLVQYAVPSAIVGAANIRISRKLKNRINIGGVLSQDTLRDRNVQRNRRMRRTKCLLISIAIIFGISWAPLNIFNIFSDYFNQEFTDNIWLIYALCHLISMSSACSNPLLYGWLNENFKKEFKDIFLCKCRRVSVEINSSGQISGIRRHNVSQVNGRASNRREKNDIQEAAITENGGTEMTVLVR